MFLFHPYVIIVIIIMFVIKVLKSIGKWMRKRRLYLLGESILRNSTCYGLLKLTKHKFNVKDRYE